MADSPPANPQSRPAEARRFHSLVEASLDLVVTLGARALAGEDLAGVTEDAAAELRALLGADSIRVLPASAGDGGHAVAPPGGVAVPIALAGRAHGMIVADARDGERFGHDELVLLQAIANVLAAAQGRVEDEQRIRYQALHDPLTGLPNRALFEDRLTRALTSNARHGRRLAVLFLDLDSFKLVCEGLNHASGDALLVAFAERVLQCLRAEDTLARVGGDEFAVLLPEIRADEDVLRVVERMTSRLATPLHVAGREIVTSAAIGIALNRGAGHKEDAQSLMRDADLAMYAAKLRGPGSWEFFAEHMHLHAVRQLELTSDLYQAIGAGELTVYFQPVVSLHDEAIVGAEALVRWNHPRHGLLPPGVFLPIAEETGLIIPMGRFVLRTACEALRNWQRAGYGAGRLAVSVNLGARQLAAPDLVGDVRAALAETGAEPSRLVLEITEDALLTREGVLERLTELKRLGLRLAVDDFGTGYSALSHLQRFPIDIIKIDKAFVDGLAESHDHARLIRGIIELTHSLGLTTVAEGIETAEQATTLRGLGSRLGQGFHFARPLPADDLEALLAAAGGDLELSVELGP